MNTPPTIILLDNGSRRPEATLNLRGLAAALSERAGLTVHPVSLLHSDKIPSSRLGGVAADTLEPFLRRRRSLGEREFLVVPLFFGHSGALSGLVPERFASLQEKLAPFSLRRSEVLCPLPQGEPLLAAILCDNVQRVARAHDLSPGKVILVDHGSPLPRVTAVRTLLARQMLGCLPPGAEVSEAVMERREGKEYDFNGRLLEEVLRDHARSAAGEPVILSLLFMSPGRHAGPGGDIEQICRRVEQASPPLRVLTTPLVGNHPGLVDILHSRLEACL